MAFTTEVLPFVKEPFLLAAEKTSEKRVSSVRGMQEVTGGADNFALQARRRPQRQVLRHLGLQSLRARRHQDGVDILFRLVAERAEVGIVPSATFELHRLFRVNTKTRLLLVTEKAVAAVVRVLPMRGLAGGGSTSSPETPTVEVEAPVDETATEV